MSRKNNFKSAEVISPTYCYASGKKKVCYQSQQLAQEKAAETELLFGHAMKVYRCPFGAHYHLATDIDFSDKI